MIPKLFVEVSKIVFDSFPAFTESTQIQNIIPQIMSTSTLFGGRLALQD